MDERHWQIFFEIHKDLPREGPGSNESTRRGFGMIEGLPDSPRILDIGCGPGMQTLELARITGGNITAVDFHQPFLDQLAVSAQKEGLADRIEIVNASMFDLPFEDESFDLIWCEGAIFIIGFAEGLRQWKRLLKPGGVMALTESAWFRPNPPRELADFWNTCYPAIMDVDGNLAVIRECGYDLVGHFSLPARDWWDNYYDPILARLPMLREQFADNPTALELLEMETVEIDFHRRFSDYYGYEFFVMRMSDATPRVS